MILVFDGIIQVDGYMDIVIFNIDPISTTIRLDRFVSALLNISAKLPNTLHISLYHKGVVCKWFPAAPGN